MKNRLNTKLFVLPLFFVAAGFLSSCSEVDEPDLRDEMTGIFEYEIKIYDNIDGELIYLGGQDDLYDITGSLLVRKNFQYSDMLDFYDGDVLIFQAENIRDAGNAIVFDVPLQEGWIGPILMQVTGYDYWEVNSKLYHGAYSYDDEQLEIAFSAYVMDVNSGLVMVLTAWRD